MPKREAVRVGLNDRFVQSIKYNESVPYYWDSSFKGASFGLRVSGGGRKAFVLVYRNKDNRQRWMTLGVYPSLSLGDARKKAVEHLASVLDGQDPATEKAQRRQAETIQDLWDLFFDRHCKAKKKSWESDKRIAEHDILPYWKHRPIADICRADVAKLLDIVMDRGSGVMANRVRALVSKMLAFAVQRSLREDNPAIGVARPHKEAPRDRVLSDDDILKLWNGFAALPLLTGSTYRLRLLTLQRGQEIYAMRWADIVDDVWTVPAESSKNGKAHRVPLSKQALEVLDELRPITADGEFVFPGRDNGDHIGARGCTATTLRRTTGVSFTPHDLRRVGAHVMVEKLGVMPDVVSAILNHTPQGITARVYMHAEWSVQKRRALGAWGRHVEAIVAGKPESNIVQFTA